MADASISQDKVQTPSANINLLIIEDGNGIHLVDSCFNDATGKPILIHKNGSKVVGLHCNPVQPDLLLSCGNDHFARIWYIRRVEAGSSIYDPAHSRVVNSAYFSPMSGSKILSTSQDSRIRIWDSIFGNMDTPSREIVHSHDFNHESLAVIGCYMSENYNGAALAGQLLAEVTDPNIITISPVNKLHPRDDVLIWQSLFIWQPEENCEPVEPKDEGKIIVSCGLTQLFQFAP
ncbi:protein DAMAGED DNA-BINDING 2-like [Pyrus ussuriensis x Pyrus communis]|uniref:Protein DAMAGED DNA-BINDING 2-like n=1 Tax=Pyrus ussuriensis x Pyrus communis TaxID=2448454 RepID=A0A5N5GP46_9ROSA|nr:protein DAMAGED DNA-BINDING 2-like [Pyrus ussuriensis x Pyrus communis]